MVKKLFVWKMVEEAIHNLGGRATHHEIIDYVNRNYNDVNQSTLYNAITYCTVNNQTRTNWSPNKKPRLADREYDLLFRINEHEYELFDREKHGIWAIHEVENGIFNVKKVEN